jgi:[ribosomal protein S5]-alanine N-acetyltransferase
VIPVDMPSLYTERLLVRPFAATDLDAVFQLLDVELGEGAGDVAPARSARQAWLAWSVLNYTALASLHQPPYGDRAIVLRASAVLIGACGLAPALLPFAQVSALRPPGTTVNQPVRNTSEIGLYWAILPAYQRRGYAAEAGAALIRYAFTELNLQRIVATTTYENAASIGVMRKLSMTIGRNPLPEPAWMQVVGVLENSGLGSSQATPGA